MKTKVLYFFSVVFLSFSCSNTNKSCYDEALYQKHKDDMCTMDCPGVIGCDGIEYCNECIARTKGIRIKK